MARKHLRPTWRLLRRVSLSTMPDSSREKRGERDESKSEWWFGSVVVLMMVEESVVPTLPRPLVG